MAEWTELTELKVSTGHDDLTFINIPNEGIISIRDKNIAAIILNALKMQDAVIEARKIVEADAKGDTVDLGLLKTKLDAVASEVKSAETKA